MRTASWFVEIATNIAERDLDWKIAAMGETLYAFAESERPRADRLAIELAEMLGDTAIVRVRHRLRAKRGVFFPRPRPARRIQAA